MHPADEFEAFKTLIENGKGIEETAAAFGVSPLVVQRRLKLANVSPRMLALYRDDEINLDQLMALAITDDHAAQERAWDSSPTYNRNAHGLRRLLTESEIDAEDNPLAIYVGVEDYEYAGGRVRRDLFSDEGGCYLEDATLLESLALAKLEKEAGAIQAEGWAWVDLRTRCDMSELSTYGRVRTVQRVPSSEEQQTLDTLSDEMNKLEGEMNNFGGTDEEYAALEEKYEAFADKLNDIEESLSVAAAEDLKLAGVIISLDHQGRLDVRRGLIRPEDKPKGKERSATEDSVNNKDKPTHSERLTRQLTAHRTGALQAMLTTRPDMALVVLAHRMAAQVFGSYHFQSVAQISIQAPNLASEAADFGESRASNKLSVHREAWASRLPVDDAESLFSWLLEQSQEDVLALLSFCTACTINAIQSDGRTNPLVDSLATALALDMADWWAPTADSYLGHVPKSRLVDVIAEAVSPEAAKPLCGMKKGDAVKAAAQRLDGLRWLPAPLRIAATAA